MKWVLMVAFWAVTSLAGEQPALKMHPFNKDWQVVINAATATTSTVWQAVTLPHTARLESVLPGNKMWMGDCLYRKVFFVSPEWENKRVCLNIEAAMHTAEVFLNEKRVASHMGGYLPFQADLSGLLAVGSTNELLIKLDNRETPDIPPGRPYSKLDFNWYHGLYRNVDLQVTDPLHITDPVAANLPASGGIFVTYPSVSPDSAAVQVQVHVKNDRSVSARFVVRCALAGQNVQSEPATLAPGEMSAYTLSLVVPAPKLWSPDAPHLYPLTTEIRTAEGVVVESQCLRVGIRSVTCKAGRFAINGRPMYLRGTNRHQEYPYIGYALPDSAQWRDAAMIKQAGFALVRLSHYPNSSAFLDACDYYGIVVMEPVPGWQFYKNGLFAERSLQMARDMIRRDRNHPACIFWETSLNEAKHPDAFLKQLHEIVGQEYPGALSASHINKFHDIFIPARQHTNGPKFWDEWKQGDKPIFTAEYGDWEYYADNAANFNQTGIKELKGEEINSRQRRSDGERRMLQQALNFQESHNQNHVCPSMIGDANWLFNDYSRGCAPDHCTSGIVDVFRLPKFVYYFYQSQRDPTDGILANPGVFIASYWTAQSSIPVRVFSNGDEVELLLNGVSLGRRKPDQDHFSRYLAHAPFTFPVKAFEPGELKAISYMGGRPVAQHVIRTPEKPARIRLVARLSGIPISRNSKDAFFVHAEIVDRNGTLVPDAALPVSFVTTEAELASPGQVNAEAGIATALLLSGGTDRPVVVQATAEGLESDSLVLLAQDTLRNTISLDGQWQIGQGVMDQVPEKFEHTVPVPGLVDLATPAFGDIGIKSGQRSAFWHPRTFTLDALPPVARRQQIITIHAARFTVLTPNCVRFEYQKDGKFTDEPTLFVNRRVINPVPFVQRFEGNATVIETSSIRIRYIPDGRAFHPGNLQVMIRKGTGWVEWTPGAKPFCNLRGPISTLDNVSGPVELPEGLLARDGWSVVDDTGKPIFVNDWIAPRPVERGLDWYLFGYGSDYKAALASLAAISGPVPIPRKHVFGSWYCRWFDYTEAQFRQIAEEYRQHDFPLDILVMDMGWHTQKDAKTGIGHFIGLGWTGWSWNRALLPNAEKLLADLRADGLFVTLNAHPHDGVRAHETCYPDFMRMLGKDPVKDEVPKFNAGDRTYMDAYFKAAHWPLEKAGVDFWWVDWQQDSKPGLEYVPGVPGLRHLPWLNHLYFTYSQTLGKRGLGFSRWGGWGDQRNPIQFSGDSGGCWEMLKFEIEFTLRSGNSGCFFWAHDIGGFFDGNDAELLARWIQFGAVSSSLRLHSYGNMDRRPWLWGPETERSARIAYHLRSQLLPYIYSSARQCNTKALPLLRPLYLEYPEQEFAYSHMNEYFFGEHLLAAPVTTKGEGVRKVAGQTLWIPEGTWFHWFSGESFVGPKTVFLKSTLDEFPLLVRGGTPIPLQPYTARMTTTPLTNLVVRCWPGKDGVMGINELYEDDGQSERYRYGDYAVTKLSYIRQGEHITIGVEPVVGTYQSQPLKRTVTIELPCVSPVVKVLSNDQAITAEYDRKTATCRIILPDRDIRSRLTIKVEVKSDLTRKDVRVPAASDP